MRSEIVDKIGATNLETIGKADNFNQWVYDSIKIHCFGKIIEIGSGIGNISKYFISNQSEIMLSDLRTQYCKELETKFSNKNNNFLGSIGIDLVAVDFEHKYKSLLNTFDTVFSLNVVEHIKDDYLAIENAKKLLKPNGKLIILVPSYNILFNRFDKELGHYRRYTKSSLSKLFVKSNLEIIHKQYFNFMGILGWYVSGKLLQKESIPKNQMKIYNLLVPIFKVIDHIILKRIGLSTIVVGQKK